MKKIVSEVVFRGSGAGNGPCLGPTGNFKMCKENVSVLFTFTK